MCRVCLANPMVAGGLLLVSSYSVNKNCKILPYIQYHYQYGATIHTPGLSASSDQYLGELHAVTQGHGYALLREPQPCYLADYSQIQHSTLIVS